jgi:peroxiredoxin
MAKVQINTPAPDFTLVDYQGNEVSLSQFKGKQNVLLVFNRGFT